MLLRLHLVSPLKTRRPVRQQQCFHQAATFGKKCRSCCQASKSVIHCTAPGVERGLFACTEGATPGWKQTVDWQSQWNPILRRYKREQKFYDAIKATYGPRHHSVHHVRTKDGVTLFKDQQGILSRWAEHLSELLNCINPTVLILLS